MKAAGPRAQGERGATGPTEIVTGPVLRRGPEDGSGVSVWVETDRPGTITCTVWPIDDFAAETVVASAPGSSTPGGCHTFEACTFTVHGHHYAIVDITGLDAGTHGYRVTSNGRVLWPVDPRAPVSRFRLWNPNEPFEAAGGSCRQHAPQDIGGTRRLGLLALGSRRAIPDREPLRREGSHGDGDTPVTDDLGADALAALAADVLEGLRALPHLLLLTGDQVYADEQHPVIRSALRRRRGRDVRAVDGPDVENFEEFTWLYRDTWAHPLIRWILSSVPSFMIFDDHDVIDDWNISDTWMQEMARNGWWPAYVTSALSSYWIYQHLGNLSTEQRRSHELFERIRGSDDGGDELTRAMQPLGTGSDERLEHTWSVAATVGPIQLVVLDSRNGRVVEPERRSMLSPRDWSLLDRVLTECSGNRQVLLVSSVPWLLPDGVHQLERWCSELVTKRRPTCRRIGEFLRRAIDLEHWAAFGDSVEALSTRLAEHCQRNPATPQPIVLSGDVHFAYLAEQPLGPGRTALQVVASPLRQGDSSRDQVARRMAFTQVFSRAIRSARRATGSRPAPPAHSLVTDVWTDNNLASFTLYPPNTDERCGPPRSVVRIEAAELREDRLRLRPLVERSISCGHDESQPG